MGLKDNKQLTRVPSQIKSFLTIKNKISHCINCLAHRLVCGYLNVIRAYYYAEFDETSRWVVY